jgi:hypothetical protein
MIRQTSLALGLVLLVTLCCSTTGSNAQEKDDARSKALQALLDFLKTKGVELRPVDTTGTYFHYLFTVGPDHTRKHRVGLNYLPPLTLEQAREKYLAYQLPTEFHRDWALIPVGGPSGNASPEYEADWKKVLAAFKEHPGPKPPSKK